MDPLTGYIGGSFAIITGILVIIKPKVLPWVVSIWLVIFGIRLIATTLAKLYI